MKGTELLGPVFVLVALTFVLHLWMGRLRVAAVKRGDVRPADMALRQPVWPPRIAKVANAYHNQLELPLLFYVLVAFVMITNTANYALLVLAWAFVAARLAHAAIHTTSNVVSQRFMAHAIALTILVVMWVLFAFRVLTFL